MRSLKRELAYTQKKSNGKKKSTAVPPKGRRKLSTLRAMSKKSKAY